MTYKALHNLVPHYASDLIAHPVLPFLLSAPLLPVPQRIRYLLTFSLAILFAWNVFLDMHMGQSFTCFRFCSNVTLSVRTSLATSYSLPLLYFSPQFLSLSKILCILPSYPVYCLSPPLECKFSEGQDFYLLLSLLHLQC